MRMRLARRAAVAAWMLAGLVSTRSEAPKFDEVLGLIRSNLTAVSEAEFNRAATEGLLDKLRGRVELIENGGPSGSAATSVAKTNLFEGSFGYVRLDTIRSGTGAELSAAIRALKEKTPLKGIILDLRFAGGHDYAGAVEGVDVFLPTAETVLKWGRDTGRTDGGEAVDLPLAVLVNKETRGAAEALAAALRDQGLALLIGQATAGQALVFEDFTLSTGQKLRIGRGKVELPGGKALGPEGLTPEIVVDTNVESERRWLEDPYLAASKGATPAGPAPFLTTLTNRIARRVTGAEVGRRHREELEISGAENGRPAAAPFNVVQDPALARGLDFLKGLTLPRLREAAKK